LLLSTVRVADASALSRSDLLVRGSYLQVLLEDYAWGNQIWSGAGLAEIRTAARRPGRSRAGWSRRAGAALPPASLAAAAAAWTMRPPSAHCATLQTVTGFRRQAA
jgi:hypothetical protein